LFGSLCSSIERSGYQSIIINNNPETVSTDFDTQKSVTEPYLVDALSFTEAEARIIEEMRPFISGEFSVPISSG